MASVRTQGTELFLINSGSVIKFACPTGITGLGGATDQIDTTCLIDNERTFAQGLANPGQVSVPFNFDPTQTSHQLLFDLKEQGVNVDWLIGLSDGTNEPTLDSIDDFIPPANRTSAQFVAYISDINIDIATNEIVRGTLTLQRSGAVEWVFYD